MPSPQEIQKLLTDFKNTEAEFKPSFYNFCCLLSSVQSTWDPNFLNQIEDVEAEIEDARENGYITDYYDFIRVKAPLLSIPTEKDLEDDAKFKKYQDAWKVYRKLIHDMNELTKNASTLKLEIKTI